MKSFMYACHTQVEMGIGKVAVLPSLLENMSVGKSILLVSDPGVVKVGLVEPIQENLESHGYEVTLYDAISQNPRDTECYAGAKLFKEKDVNIVVAIGGGSAMDTAKAIALFGPNGGTLQEYEEGTRPYKNIAPIICIPTTAGTGSEVTRSSVITEANTHRKVTLKHVNLRPSIAILDPALTYTVPQSITAATGVDALVHAIEGYTCKITNPISQALGAKAMETIVRALPTAYKDGESEWARFNMMEGSLLAGLCFGSADVAAVHCLAEALGSLYDTPHGVANAVFLPHILRFNAQENIKMHATLSKIMQFASDRDSDEKAVLKLVEGIEEFTQKLNIPKLKDLPGIKVEDFDKIVELSFKNGSTPSNVRTITSDNYRVILERTYAM